RVEEMIAYPLPYLFDAPDREPLRSVLGRISTASGAKLVVNWTALQASGVDQYTPITVRASNTTASDMLCLILRDAAGDSSGQFRVQDGTVAISTRANF